MTNYPVLVTVILLLSVTAAAAQWQMPCGDLERARGLMLDGLDLALKSHTSKLFENRLKDADPSPARIQLGMRRAITSWSRSREQVKNWTLSCREN